MATTRGASVQGTSQTVASRARVVKAEVQPEPEASAASQQECVKHLPASLLSQCVPLHVQEHQEEKPEAYARPSSPQQSENSHDVLVLPLCALVCASASEQTGSQE